MGQLAIEVMIWWLLMSLLGIINILLWGWLYRHLYLTLSQGFEDMQRMTVTGRLADWRYPMVWMSLYFSVAVWISLAIVFLPFRITQSRLEPSQPSQAEND